MNEVEILKNEIKIINELNQKIQMEMNFDEVIDSIIYSLRGKIEFDDCNISLIVDNKYLKTRNLKISNKVKDINFAEEFYNRKWYLNEKAIGCIVYNTQNELLFEDFNKIKLDKDTRLNIDKLGLRAFYCLPLKLNNRIYGVMGIANYDEPIILNDLEKEMINNRCIIIARAIENYFVYDKVKNQKEILEKQAGIINEDLKLAKRIQMNFFKNILPEIKGIDIDTKFIPMFDVGGDFFDFYISRKVDNFRKFGVLITDASGHGIQAAFITSMIKTIFENESMRKKLTHPKKVLEILNNELFDKLANNFVTGQYGLIDLDKYFLEISNAGHNPVYLIRKNILHKIEVKGRVIGLFEDSKYIKKRIKIEKDDILFFYTDGLTEAINEKEEVFENTLEEILIKNSNKTSKEINLIISTELKIFTQKEQYDDDIALITIKIK